jgi:3',5'-cyclic AMP phosphodiesterase CpdA
MHEPANLGRSISRRAALAAFGGLLAWPAAIRARERTIPEISLAIVTDTHLGRDDPPGSTDFWMKAAREIDKTDSEIVLHLGDVVDNGREKQYDVYKDIRKAIRKPIHEIPGNHDPRELFAKHIRREVDVAVDHHGVRFLLLNNARFGETDGFLSREQIRWLGDQCGEAARKNLFIVMAMHVPAHTNTDHAIVGAFVKPENGQTDLYELLKKHEDRVLALLHGHFHCGLRGWDSHAPLQELVFPSTLYNRNLMLALRKAPGFNTPEFRPGYVLAKIGKDGLHLSYKPIGFDEPRIQNMPLPQLKT